MRPSRRGHTFDQTFIIYARIRHIILRRDISASAPPYTCTTSAVGIPRYGQTLILYALASGGHRGRLYSVTQGTEEGGHQLPDCQAEPVESKTWTSRGRDLDPPDDETTSPYYTQTTENKHPGRLCRWVFKGQEYDPTDDQADLAVRTANADGKHPGRLCGGINVLSQQEIKPGVMVSRWSPVCHRKTWAPRCCCGWIGGTEGCRMQDGVNKQNKGSVAIQANQIAPNGVPEAWHRRIIPQFIVLSRSQHI